MAVNQSENAYEIKIIVGRANEKLGQDVSKLLKTAIAETTIGSFADGEIQIQIQENMRGGDVFIIQPTCPDVNQNLMELLLLIHTLTLASAKRITAVVPYFGYARQDRKTKPRVPISASAVAQLIEAMRPQRIVTIDLHCGQIQGFFHHIPVDNLTAEKEFVAYLRTLNLSPDSMAIVSPDAGGVQRAQSVADSLQVRRVVTIIKRRAEANHIASMQIVGEVKGMIAIIVDDMIDTAGTLKKAAEKLKSDGAVKVYACATHGVFSGPALDRINDSCLEEVCVTDTLPQAENAIKCKKIHVISIAPLLAAAVRRCHEEKSLSVLFRPNAKSALDEDFQPAATKESTPGQ
eukprot:TRINITY_DN5061_c0_g1_i1.p1 TRINITY_DN5061_c0_g1~~TRINITY_DN5061_c0_g1_i1.p1  ORF type:complete len:348 (+),score=57.37 TRINITY_DN5061_c0_g1_i1:52-1095(+)